MMLCRSYCYMLLCWLWCDCLDSKQRKSKQNNGACVWEPSGVCCLLLPWINQCFLVQRWVVRCINKTTQTCFNVCFHVLGVLKMARPCLRHWLICGGKQSHLVSQALHCSLLKETLFFPIRLSPETQLWVCVVRGMPGIHSTCFLKPGMHLPWFYHLRQISIIVRDLFRYKVKWKSLIALCDISGWPINSLFAKSPVTSWQCLWVTHLQND